MLKSPVLSFHMLSDEIAVVILKGNLCLGCFVYCVARETEVAL